MSALSSLVRDHNKFLRVKTYLEIKSDSDNIVPPDQDTEKFCLNV